jgi:hypothetical protein
MNSRVYWTILPTRAFGGEAKGMVLYAFIFVSPSCHTVRCKVHFIMLASPSADGLSRTRQKEGDILCTQIIQ